MAGHHSQGYEPDDSDDEVEGGPFHQRAHRGDCGGQYLTLALLEDIATVLLAHGFPPLRGYALAELTSSLYRIQDR